MVNKGRKKVLRWGRRLLAMIVFLASLLAMMGWFAPLFYLQAAPALLKVLAVGAIGAGGIFLGLILLTFLFGRFYCSLLCPLGLLQDGVGCFSKRAGGHTPSWTAWRYLFAGVVFGTLIGGSVIGFRLLDPYSNFGRMASFTSLFSVGAILFLATLVLWRKRFFCNMLCPVGTLLGIFSKRGLFRLAITETCVGCGQCAKQCPAGCIDPAQRQIENDRCVRCMTCLSICPKDAIQFTKAAPPPVKEDRRTFLVNSAMLLAGIGAGVSLAKVSSSTMETPSDQLILPPGAGDSKRFSATCTACYRCVRACPEGIIIPPRNGVAPVVVDLNRGACRYDCKACIEVCPTGALLPLTLHEKQHTQLGVAKFNAKLCKVFQEDEPCGDCATVCPTKAVRLRKTGAPYPVKAALCIGCGECQKICSATKGKAIVVQPIETQTCIGETK